MFLWETGRFKLFLYRGINTMHKFLCMCNAICMHVKCTVIPFVHAISEGLYICQGFKQPKLMNRWHITSSSHLTQIYQSSLDTIYFKLWLKYICACFHTAYTWSKTGLLNYNIIMTTQVVICCFYIFCSGETLDAKYFCI